MTRLTSSDIDAIPAGLAAYDRILNAATGRSLLGIGAAAAGWDDEDAIGRLAATIRMAVVPIRSGQGIIQGFTGSVAAILAHLGFDARITGQTDVAGLAEAIDAGAQVIFAADDHRFVAVCPRHGRVVDNARATADGFVAGLDLMAGGLAGGRVLVLGCGRVGRWAVQALVERGARIGVADRIAAKAADLAARISGATIEVAADLDRALATHDLIIEATNAAEVIRARHIRASTRISAPGMPCGLSPNAMQKCGGRLLHDPLQIGVAAMACRAAGIVTGKLSTGADGERYE
jgi:pyrrolysine biosynthesis protein PylD